MLSNAEHCRITRLRKAGRLPPPERCDSCGKRTLRPRDGLCRDCWLRTPDGKAATREKVARHRAAKRSGSRA